MKRRTLITRAHAKVNLDLRVLGVRADGYHELRTVFQAIELHDTLRVHRAAGPVHAEVPHAGRAARREQPGVEGGGGAVDGARPRAARSATRWSRSTSRSRSQAGLGGGSADAAAALSRSARLWGGAPITLLREVGATIGADVPFFLSGGTALGLGRGEEIYPLVDLPPHFVVIVRPPFGVSTAEAYGWYDEDRAAGSRENARVPAAAGAVADARGADDQRSRAAGHPPAPGDRRAEGSCCARRGRSRRRCRAAARPFSACSAAGRRPSGPLNRCPVTAQRPIVTRTLEPRRARAAGASRCHKGRRSGYT